MCKFGEEFIDLTVSESDLELEDPFDPQCAQDHLWSTPLLFASKLQITMT